MSLNPNVIYRLTRIFEEKGWPTRSARRSLDGQRFESFSKILSIASSDQANLILDLTMHFEKYTHEQILVGFSVALDLAGPDYFRGADSIFVVPLSDPSEADRNKSGAAFAYPFIHNVLRPFLNTHAIFLNWLDYKNLNSINRHIERGKSIIIAVDDFVGSGSTADKFIEKFNSVCKDSDKLLIITAGAMRSGVEYIVSKGVDIFTGTIYSKGISDSPFIEDVDRALSIMDEIESLIKVDEGCNRGYQSCEALVSFIRTPDNTFPLYWAEKKMNGEDWPCPFPR